MRWLATLVFGILFLGQSGPVAAGELLQNFVSELMLHESKQVLRPDRVVRYADPEGGATLRALLAPARTTVVLDEYFSELGRGNAQLEVQKLVEPLVKRYEKAFTADPRAYEEEYLDSLNIVVGLLERSARRVQPGPPAAPAPPGVTAADADAMRKLLDSLQGLSDTMITLVAKTIRERANSGVFSAAGQARALVLADRLTVSVRPAPPPAAPVWPTQSALASPMAPMPMRGSAVTPADIEDTFKRHPLVSPEALSQMQQCDARMTRRHHEQFVSEANKGQSGTTLLSFSDGSTMLAVVGFYWTCVKLGPTGNPVLPVEALRNTVTTVGAGNAALSAWRRKILAELAMSGKATALVGMSTGYASSVVYTLTRSPSMTLTYDVKNLQPGSYNRADYQAVLLEPGITSTVVIKVGLREEKNAAALFAPVGRLPLTADGYIAIAGSAGTASTDFSGTVWKAQSPQRAVSTLRLDPQGVATLQTQSTTQTGQWKVAGNVLHILLNTDVRYSLALSADGRFLDGDIRRKELPRPNFPGAPAVARHDDADDDLRFKSLRFYKPTDTEYEKALTAKSESAGDSARFSSAPGVRDLFARAELSKAQILSETPEKEAEEQARYPKPYVWRTCDAVLMSELMSAYLPKPAPEFAGRTVGDVCHSWLGVRKDWKATILQEGCRGRCSHF